MQFSTMRATDVRVLSEILSAAFAFPAADAPAWLKVAKPANVRVARDGKRVVGCLVVVPMGHYFGGRVVPTAGIAGVAVALDARGRGVARGMMEHVVLESARKGVALSTLYPATQTLYRRAGYERAGKLCEIRLATSHFTAPRTTLVSRTLTEKDHHAVEAAYASSARDRNGYLARGPYMWSRVRRPRGKATYGIGFFSERGALEAYVHFLLVPSDESAFYTVVVKDAAATTSRGYDAVVRYIGELRSCGREVELRAGPSDPLLMRLAEPHYEEKSVEDWMVRVVDVKAAIEARGYTKFQRASVVLDVRDALVPANHRAVRVDVADGRAKVSAARATKDAIRLDVRALAPLFTGYLSATRLAALGELEGSVGAIEAADAVFHGPMPSMNEMF